MIPMLSMSHAFYQDPQDLDDDLENQEIDFEYKDSDSYPNEISELYSYTEALDFQKNLKSFRSQMILYSMRPFWVDMTSSTKRSVVMKLLNQLEVADRVFRMQSARCVLYILQGCWDEVQTKEEQLHLTKENVLLLYKMGTFPCFIELLNIEIEEFVNAKNQEDKSAFKSFKDPSDLRCILCVLYIIVETIRDQYTKGICEDYKEIGLAFRYEINHPWNDGELLAVKLFKMINLFGSKAALHFPVKKISLLLWKVLLFGLGGWETLKDLKTEYREKKNLPPVPQDTLEEARRMKASNFSDSFNETLIGPPPPRKLYKKPSARKSTLKEQQTYDLEFFSFLKSLNISNDHSDRLMKSLEKSKDAETEIQTSPTSNNTDEDSDSCSVSSTSSVSSSTSRSSVSSANTIDTSSFSSTCLTNIIKQDPHIHWTPKVRQKEILHFLNSARKKFIGFTLPNDDVTLAGLPKPIVDGFTILQQYKYTSLGDEQIKEENILKKYPLTAKPEEIYNSSTERLFKALLPHFAQYLSVLLKLLLASWPTTKPKPEIYNLSLELSTTQMPITNDQALKLEVDLARHKEIITKALSSVVLLLMKHFKLNHIYQFELMTQQLIFSNALPFLMKFFNQNLMDFIQVKHNLPLLEFPSCVIHDPDEICAHDKSHNPEKSHLQYSWRNIFCIINMLRIMNKIVKGKSARIMMMVMLKTTPVLKRALKVRHPIVQLYILKLFKLETRNLGRQWRKSNMQTIGAIYSKVRHRLNDDWVYGADIEPTPWDFQIEENSLRDAVKNFIKRRYPEEFEKLTPDNIGSCASLRSDNTLKSIGAGPSNSAGRSASTTNLSRNSFESITDLFMASSNDFCIHSEDIFQKWDPESLTNWWFADDDDPDLSEEFKANYESWLENNVYNNQIDWDAI